MPLPPLTSYKQILFPTAAVAQLVDDLVTNTLPFPANGKNGLVIFGPPGTGKTALMQLLPEPIEQHRSCEPAYSPNFHPIDSTTSVPVLFKSIKTRSGNMPLTGKYNYFLLDEVDQLKSEGMRSLKGAMHHTNAIFIFTTNDLASIDPPIRSRSHLIDMNPPPPAAALSLVKQAIMDELAARGIARNIDDEMVIKIIEGCCGDMREIGSQIDKTVRDLISAPQKP